MRKQQLIISVDLYDYRQYSVAPKTGEMLIFKQSHCSILMHFIYKKFKFFI
uniref:Uncharacterized protein n=1 Tax=Meloidogyne enterolobii TaxID=390850 RepID=A0A6V7UX87_MELEN|nr:unnamed protein product [Meloidogyne enterolobii]